MAMFQINECAKPGCTEREAWGVSEWVDLHRRVWEQQGDLFPQCCDTEAQQQVPQGACSPAQAPAQTRDPKAGKHLWRHHGKEDWEGQGRGEAAGSAVVISRFCHGTHGSHTLLTRHEDGRAVQKISLKR